MAQKNVLCDTGILIQVLRRDGDIIKKLDLIGRDQLYISIISVAEIFNGTRKNERDETLNFLNSLNVLHLDKNISKRFKSLSNYLFQKDNTIPVEDLLIASTAIEYGYELYTLNKKDFSNLPGIKLYKP
jgi:predicted nucleic acid-binding protein